MLMLDWSGKQNNGMGNANYKTNGKQKVKLVRV